jgi:xylose isomerase
VKVLEDAQWPGMRHFDAHPYRTEDADGVWDFVRGCMRTYLILADKARRFREDPEIQDALATAMSTRLDEPTRPAGGLDELRQATFDEAALAAQGYGHERLDQLVTELLLGAR